MDKLGATLEGVQRHGSLACIRGKDTLVSQSPFNIAFCVDASIALCKILHGAWDHITLTKGFEPPSFQEIGEDARSMYQIIIY